MRQSHNTCPDCREKADTVAPVSVPAVALSDIIEDIHTATIRANTLLEGTGFGV